MENKLTDLIGKVIEGVQTANYNGSEASGLILFFTDGATLTISERYIDGWQGFSVSLNLKGDK